MLKQIIRQTIRRLGYEIHRPARPEPVPTGLYQPFYSPWISEEFAPYYSIASPRTVVRRDICYVLERLFRQ